MKARKQRPTIFVHLLPPMKMKKVQSSLLHVARKVQVYILQLHRNNEHYIIY
jgi:hypothetical protein